MATRASVGGKCEQAFHEQQAYERLAAKLKHTCLPAKKSAAEQAAASSQPMVDMTNMQHQPASGQYELAGQQHQRLESSVQLATGLGQAQLPLRMHPSTSRPTKATTCDLQPSYSGAINPQSQQQQPQPQQQHHHHNHQQQQQQQHLFSVLINNKTIKGKLRQGRPTRDLIKSHVRARTLISQAAFQTSRIRLVGHCAFLTRIYAPPE